MSDAQAVLTEQAIFDAVCEHMDKQRSPSMDEATGSCAYRGDGGKACAVGCLLSDQEASEVDNCASVCQLESVGLLPRRLRTHAALLRSLQRAHDAASEDGKGNDTYMREWKRSMESVSRVYSLSTARLDAIEV